MKLLRYGPIGQEKPGLLDAAGRIRDLSTHVADIGIDTVSDETLATLRALDPATLPLVEGSPRLGVPVAGIRQCLAIGLNYRQHAAEANMALPSEPSIFFKAITSISGPDDDVVLPEHSEMTDWEIELAVVIGKTARSVPLEQAFDHVAGYTIANDVSERDWQINRAGQWSKGKSFDTFCPLGPWLVTRDEIADPHALGMSLHVDDSERQRSSTADMVFGVQALIAYCSRFMTLLPGDVIITGTPQGVGWGMKPQTFLKAGQVMRLAIDGLGEQRQRVVPTPA